MVAHLGLPGYGLQAPAVEKSIYSSDQQVLCRLLRRLRTEAGLRQVDVAAALAVNQTFVSKYEKGERRLDLVELRLVCSALNTDLPTFVAAFEAEREDA